MLSFVYSDRHTLRAAQAVFLTVADGLLTLLYTVGLDHRVWMFDLIAVILQRAELSDLTVLGFDPLHQVHTCTHIHIHTRVHTYIHTYIRLDAYMHSYIFT